VSKTALLLTNLITSGLTLLGLASVRPSSYERITQGASRQVGN